MNKKAFTLLELLVYLGILALLLTIALIAFENARARTRNTKRVADINQIQKALELYFNTQEDYPEGTDLELGTENAQILCSGPSASGFQSSNTICGDSPVVYIDRVPKAFGLDSDCKAGGSDRYLYTKISANDYNLIFCLGRKIGDLGPGSCIAKPGKLICQ